MRQKMDMTFKTLAYLVRSRLMSGIEIEGKERKEKLKGEKSQGICNILIFGLHPLQRDP